MLALCWQTAAVSERRQVAGKLQFTTAGTRQTAHYVTQQQTFSSRVQIKNQGKEPVGVIGGVAR